MIFRFKRRISIVLESNDKGAIDKITNKYFKAKIKDNDPEDKDTFVCISSSIEEIKPKGCCSGQPIKNSEAIENQT